MIFVEVSIEQNKRKLSETTKIVGYKKYLTFPSISVDQNEYVPSSHS